MSKSHYYNVSFERAVLTSILFDPIYMEIVLESGMTPDDFFHPFHRKLFRTMQELYGREPLEEEVIRLNMGSTFDETAMIDILAASPVGNVEYYVDALKELSRLRHLREMATKLLQKTEEGEGVDEAVHAVYNELERLEEGREGLFTIVPLVDVEEKEAEFVCKSWLPFPKNAVSLVTAGGGVGKSFLLLQAAIRMVRDEGLKVFMWLSEDPVSLSKHRFELITKRLLETEDHPNDRNLHIAGAEEETIHFLEEGRGGVTINPKIHQFKRMLKEYDVVILDPLIALFGGDENNNAQARMFINLFTRWATKEGKTIVFIHHGTKNTSQSRGASAFVDAVRLVYRVEHVKNDKGEPTEEEMRWIILDKDNNGAKKYLGAHKVKRQVFPKKKKRGIEIIYDSGVL